MEAQGLAYSSAGRDADPYIRRMNMHFSNAYVAVMVIIILQHNKQI